MFGLEGTNIPCDTIRWLHTLVQVSPPHTKIFTVYHIFAKHFAVKLKKLSFHNFCSLLKIDYMSVPVVYYYVWFFELKFYSLELHPSWKFNYHEKVSNYGFVFIKNILNKYNSIH